VGAVVLGDDDDATGLLVETVDDAGAEFAADLRELVEVTEESVDDGSGEKPSSVKNGTYAMVGRAKWSIRGSS
jgi:hypothetical protein